MRPLPAGMNLVLVTDPRARRLVHRAAAEAIIGYGASAAEEDNRREAYLAKLFAHADGAVPFTSRMIAATDEAGTALYGAAIIEAFVSDDLAKREAEVARNMARVHYVLAGMFVAPELRGQGIGTQLIEQATLDVARHQGRYLDGFVDKRNGSARFYARAGATVGGRNRGLPARRPTNTELWHPEGVDGNWFYFDCWQRHADLMYCARCRGPLTFNPADGGDMECVRCGPPPADYVNLKWPGASS